MNKVPGDDDSIKGHNVRGIYWTKPDESGKRSCERQTNRRI